MSAPWTASWALIAIGRPMIAILLSVALIFAMAAARRSGSRDAHKRGARILDGRPAQRRTARAQLFRSQPRLTIAGVSIAPGDEVKHFKLIGTTGTGKSTVIRELLAMALDRGDRAVITDPDGGYLARLYDPGRG